MNSSFAFRAAVWALFCTPLTSPAQPTADASIEGRWAAVTTNNTISGSDPALANLVSTLSIEKIGGVVQATLKRSHDAQSVTLLSSGDSFYYWDPADGRKVGQPINIKRDSSTSLTLTARSTAVMVISVFYGFMDVGERDYSTMRFGKVSDAEFESLSAHSAPNTTATPAGTQNAWRIPAASPQAHSDLPVLGYWKLQHAENPVVAAMRIESNEEGFIVSLVSRRGANPTKLKGAVAHGVLTAQSSDQSQELRATRQGDNLVIQQGSPQSPRNYVAAFRAATEQEFDDLAAAIP